MSKEGTARQSDKSRSSSGKNESPPPPPPLWRLPDAVLFHILCFVAPATHRAAAVCHQLAPLSRDATHVLLRQETCALWDIILCQDYGGDIANFKQQSSSSSSSLYAASASTATRRASKRLRQSTLQGVQRAHSK